LIDTSGVRRSCDTDESRAERSFSVSVTSFERSISSASRTLPSAIAGLIAHAKSSRR
jgi:hypothetical protein